jgi:hypothetical protein
MHGFMPSPVLGFRGGFSGHIAPRGVLLEEGEVQRVEGRGCNSASGARVQGIASKGAGR